MRQRGCVAKTGIRAIHHVLMMTVVARPEAVAAIPESWATLQPRRFQRFQRMKIRIAVVDRFGDRHEDQYKRQKGNHDDRLHHNES